MIPFESDKVMLERKTGFSKIISPTFFRRRFFTQIETDTGGFLCHSITIYSTSAKKQLTS